MSVLATYRRVLANRDLARLLFGEFVSSIGDWLYLVALLIVIYERAADPVVLGVVGAARVVPYILLSLPAGMVADRFDRRLVLLVTDLARGTIMLLMAFTVVSGGSVEAIVVLAIVATCFSAFFSPAIGSYIPALVKDESELGPANSTWSTLDNLAFVVGPAIAGLLIGFGGLVPAFLLNAASFGVVAAVLWRLPPSRAGSITSKAASVTSTAEGLSDEAAAADAPKPVDARASWSLRPLARPLIAINLLGIVGGFVAGGLGVLTVVIAVDILQSGDTGTGLLNAAVGIGGLVGGVISGVLVLRQRLGPPLVAGGIVAGVALWIVGGSDMLALSMAAIAGVAAGGLLVDVVTTTLFQRIVPDEVRGRTIGLMETLAVTAYAAGSFTLPVLAGSIGIQGVLAASGIALAASALLAVPLLGRFAVQRPPPDAARERLARVPILAGLPPARLETAMARATVLRVPAGEVVIRQGDPADLFYVIAEGSVEVSQRDRSDVARTLRQMGPDEVFGEIGLLSGTPRTATVTALVPTTLLALGRADFLELVGSGPGLTSRLLDLHRGATAQGSTGGR